MSILIWLALWLACSVILLAFWYVAHPWFIDRGEGARDWWDRHSKWHILGGAAVCGLYQVFHFDVIPTLLAVGVIGGQLELLQLYPRDKGSGKAEVADLVWDMVGAVILLLLLAAL